MFEQRVMLVTHQPISDLDGYPKTQAYFDAYKQAAGVFVGYRKHYTKDGTEFFKRCVSVPLENVKEVIAF